MLVSRILASMKYSSVSCNCVYCTLQPTNSKKKSYVPIIKLKEASLNFEAVLIYLTPKIPVYIVKITLRVDIRKMSHSGAVYIIACLFQQG